MRVLLLGSGTSAPAARSAPGLYVTAGEQGVLIDPGPGTVHRLGAAGVSPLEIDDIVLTHFHPDHVCDLVPFLFCLRHPRFLMEPGGLPSYPRLIGPEGLAQFYSLLRQPFANWLPVAGEELELIETDGSTLESGRFCLHGEKVQHLASSLAWKITDIRGSTFAFSGDTEMCPGVVGVAREVDLLFLECSSPKGQEVSGHLDPETASEVMRQSGAKRTVLVHLNPECDEVDLVGQLDGDVRDRAELGRDGTWYEVESASS